MKKKISESLYMFLSYAVGFVFHIIFSYKIIGKENIPREGAALVVLNHRSYWDLPFAGMVMRRPLRYMAKAELFKNPVFGAFIKMLGAFPVQRGKGDLGAIKTSIKILEGGDMLLIFPEGRRVKDGKRGKAKQGAAYIAAHTGSDVIPVYISGEYKFRHRIIINIGKPMKFSKYTGQKLGGDKLDELSEEILDNIYSLEEKI